MKVSKNIKLLFLLVMLVALSVFLSSCYVEPDRTIDGDTLVGNNTQNFETVVTPTPTATPEPVDTPEPEPEVTAEPLPEFTFEPTVQPTSDLNLDVFNNDKRPLPSEQSVHTPVPVPKDKATATPKPTAQPKPTVSVLKTGSEGSRVKELQKRLKQLGYYTGKVDGRFGQGTEEALKHFQEKNKLRADGVAGIATIKRIYSKNATKTNISNSTSATSKNTTTNNHKNNSIANNTQTHSQRLPHMPNVPKNKYVSTSQSNSGADVRNIQNRLIDLGYLVGVADGIYGASTELAIVAFQKANMSYADGIVGPETFSVLYSTKAKKASKPVAIVVKPGESLKEGSTGETVRILQKRLIELGYLQGKADGSYGPTTMQAVQKFQLDNGINADGVAGEETVNLLFMEYPKEA